jgi:hypothetical protein
MPNVLADRHHAGLFHSLQLMAKRFGWTLYTPIGHDWWDEGYWRFGEVFGDDRLAQQYLVNQLSEMYDNEFPDERIRGVSLEEAKAMDWAFVIATVQENQHGFSRFARERGAKFVVQVGNTGQLIDWGLDPLVLNSSEMPILGRGVQYHQEMDPIPFTPPGKSRSAASFVNCMPYMGPCWDLLQKSTVPVEVYGIDGPQGVVKPYSRELDIMASVGWGWHDKGQGDGFGHVLHSWAMVGRPIIGHASHYAGKMAWGFWRDGETCIDLDRHSIEEACEIVKTITPQKHLEMCHAIRAEFDKIDYEAEAQMIREFLA